MTVTLKRLGLAALACLPSLALAHPGHGDTGLATGLLHPLTGADHLLAMIAVGFWGAHLGGRARWQLPLAFIGALFIGGLLGQSNITPPGVEPMILASSIVIGLALAIAGKLPTAIAATLCATFAVFHGVAHGAEMPLSASATAYSAGFVLATLALHLTGLASGVLASRVPALHRWIGAVVAGTGVALSLS